MPKGIPNEGEKIITKDPITGKITGSKVITFKDSEKAENKREEFTLEEVSSKGEGEQPTRKHPGGRPKGIHTPLSPEAMEARTSKKKKFNANDYKENSIAKLINISIPNVINKTFLATKPLKMTYEDMQKISFGESLLYVIDYYAPRGIDIDHPLIILTMAILGLSMKTIELANKKPEPVTI